MKYIVVALSLLMLSCCASAPKKHCTVNACGDVCCTNDGKVCPPCWKDLSKGILEHAQ